MRSNKVYGEAYFFRKKTDQIYASIGEESVPKEVKASALHLDLWVANKIVSNSAAYNLVYSYVLKRNVCESHVSDAVNALSQKFEDLRISFHGTKDSLKIVVEDTISCCVNCIGIDSLEEYSNVIYNFVNDEFNVGLPPLWKVLLVNFSPCKQELWFNFHHLVADGNSLKSYIEYFDEVLQNKTTDTVEVNSVAYINCSFADQDTVDTAYLDKLLDACLHTNIHEAYKESFPKMELILPNRLRFSLKEHEFTIRKYLASHNVSLFEFLISVFSFLISRIFSKNKFSIAYPNNCRPSSSFYVSGYAVTTLPIFFDFSLFKTVEDLINFVKKERLSTKLMGNILYSFIAKSYRKLFPTESVGINVVFSKTFLGSLSVDDCVLESKFIPFYRPAVADLIAYYDDNLEFELEWNHQKISKDFASTIMNVYKNVVEFFLKDTRNSLLSEIGLLSSDQEDAVVQVGSGGSPSSEVLLIHEIVEKWSKIKKDSVALETLKEQLSYADLWNISKKIAAFLLKHINLRSGDTVLVFANKNFEVFGAIIAIFKSRGIYVPVDPSYPPERISYIINTINPQVILVGTNAEKEQFKTFYSGTAVFVINEIISFYEPYDNEKFEKTHEDDIAYIVFTSGTTGNPKGVVVTHKSIANFIQQQAIAMRLSADSRMLHFAPLSFDTSFSEWCVAFVAGARVCFVNYSSNTEAVLALSKDINFFSISHAIMTPSLISTLKCEEVPTLQVLVSAGEPCSNELIKHWVKNVAFFNACGPTETTVGSNIYLIDQNTDSTHVGRALPGVNEYVLDMNRHLLPFGVIGEIAIGGVCVSNGYINDPELTNSKFTTVQIGYRKDRIYLSGDIGMLLPDGRLRIFGRTDNQVKIRGFRVELEEIRLAIQKNPGIIQVVVQATDSDFCRQIFAYLKIDKNCAVSYADFGKKILNNIAKSLPYYMIPSKVFIMEDFVLNEHGKVDISKSRILNEVNDSLEASQLKVDANMKKLIDIWENITGKVLDLRASFFESGGDSISAINLLCEIEESFGLNINVQSFLKNPTLINLYSLINGSEDSSKNFAETDIKSLDVRSFRQCDNIREYILITGITGFIGARVLQKLLELNYKVCCLVRDSSVQDVFSKLSGRIGICNLSNVKFLFNGDLAKENFGISDESFLFLKNNVNTVYHIACHVNHVWDYSALRKTNVIGTQNLINFIAENGIKLVYVSALSAINDVDEKGNITETLPKTVKKKMVIGGYSETKWVSEFLVSKAIAKGTPAVIFRPCSVVPCNVADFKFLKNDHLILLLKDIIKTKIAPQSLHPVIPLSVDFVVDEMLKALYKEEIWCKGVVNLTPQRVVCWERILDIINKRIPLKIVPYNIWISDLKKASHDRYIFPISTLYGSDNDCYAKWKIGKSSVDASMLTREVLQISIKSIENLIDMIYEEIGD
jgi:amino acid adenylation domain-containing protein/thioester reductase-like protein